MIGEVSDEEELYRRIRQSAGEQLCYRIEVDRTIFLHAAFNDPSKQPSVDRALLKISRNAHHTRLSTEDGVVALRADAVRRLGPIHKLDSKRRPTGEPFTVYVKPDPRRANCSHALIGMTPPTAGGAVFTRLKEGLVRLANDAQWRIKPSSPIASARPGWFRDSLNCLVHRLRGRL